MANNYCEFSFIIPCETAIAKEELLAAFASAEEGDEEFNTGCIIQGDTEGVWIASEESGNPDEVSEVIQTWLKTPLGRPKYVAFEFSFTCSKPRIGEFGGGAVFITGDDCEWCNTGIWVQEQEKKLEQKQN